MKQSVCAFLLVLVLSVAGCAYYNTFYNAKQNFADAVKDEETEPGKANKDLLEKCITRCEKVVKYHPRSKWVDDALLLMGKCFYYLGEHRSALRKFEEIELYYSRGGLLPQAYYYSGLASQALGDREGAIANFLEVKNISPRSELGEKASYQMVNTYVVVEDFDSAISSSEEFLANYPRSKYKSEVLLLRAESLLKLEKHEEAIISLEDFLELKPKKELRFKAMMKMGEAYLALWEVDEALKIFLSLRKEDITPSEDAALGIKIAEAKQKLLHPEEAITQFEEVVALYPKTPFAAEALYKIGQIYEKELGDLEKARKSYEKARTEAQYSEFANLALMRSTSIARLTEYRNKVKTGGESELAEAQFLLAELYYLEFNKIDESIAEYRKVLNEYPTSEYAPKAALSIAWILEHDKSQREEATQAYMEVVKDYPNTPYSEAAQKGLSRIEEGKFSP
jgi:TolA-binding protein